MNWGAGALHAALPLALRLPPLVERIHPTRFICSNRGGGRRDGKRRDAGKAHNIEVGDIFEEAEVVNILSFGAFVHLTPEADGLLHISEIEWGRVERVTDRLKLGDKVKVKVIRIERGKVNVSMKALLPKPTGDNKKMIPAMMKNAM